MTTAVTLPPSPPPTREDPANFAVRSDAYHSWLVPAVGQMNTQNAENNTLAQQVSDQLGIVISRVAETNSAVANATAAANTAAAQVTLATAQATTATTQAGVATGQASTATAAVATISGYATTAQNNAAAAGSSATAANAVVLGLGAALSQGVGAMTVNANGELVATWNEPTVTTMTIDGSGNLQVTYP